MATAQGCLGPPEVRRRRKNLPQEPPAGVGTCPHLTADFWLQTQRINFCCLKLPSTWLFVPICYSSPVTLIQWPLPMGLKSFWKETGRSFLSLQVSLFEGQSLLCRVLCWLRPGGCRLQLPQPHSQPKRQGLLLLPLPWVGKLRRIEAGTEHCYRA